jgi:MFS family permease
VLAGLSLWLLAYAARPLGGLIFAEVRHRHGRGVRLTTARILLGASTAAIAFLPGASTGASAIVLLAGCRALQGLAMGGASEPVAGPSAGRRAAAILVLAGLVGLIAAGGLFAALQAVLTPKDFLDWGWRYPFFLAIPINVAALFADLRLLATDSSERPSRRSLARLATVSGSPVDRDAD